MSIGVLDKTNNNIYENIKLFFKNEKVRKILFIVFILLLFFLITEYLYSAPTPSTPTPTVEEEIDANVVADKIGESIDDFFTMIMTQLAVMVANLSAVVLALCILFFTIDFLLKILTNIGNLSLASLILPNLPSIITFSIIVFLLLPSGQNVSTTMGTGASATTISTTINNYQMITMGTPDMTQLSLLTGFLEMGKQFFGTKMAQLNFIKPSDVFKTVLTIPFTIWGLAFAEGVGKVGAICFVLLSIFSVFTVISLIKDMLMAFISYVLVVGLSVILMPFLLFQKTAQIGGSIISNIVNKGLSLAIRLGLIGVVINIITTLMDAFDKATKDSINMGTTFQTAFVLMIGMFIAGEGGQVADSVLSGKVANLSAGNFIGGAVGKIMGAGTAIAVLTKKAKNWYQTRRENNEVNQSNQNRNQANEQDQNQIDQNNAQVDSARNEYNNAYTEKANADRRVDSARNEYKRAIASGNQAEIQKAKRKLASEEYKQEMAGRNLSEQDNNLKRTERNASESNNEIRNRMTARNEQHERVSQRARDAQANRRSDIAQTRENAQKRAKAIASALGGAEAGNMASNSVSSIIAVGEAMGSGAIRLGSAGLSVARGTAVLGLQSAKGVVGILSGDAQMVSEVRNDLSDMAKHYYKDRVNAMADTLRTRTAGIRNFAVTTARGVTNLRTNIAVNGGGVSGVQNMILNSRPVQSFAEDSGFGDRNVDGHTNFRTKYDPTAYKMSADYNRRYAEACEDMGYTVRNEQNEFMSIDEIRQANNLTAREHKQIKNRMAFYTNMTGGRG